MIFWVEILLEFSDGNLTDGINITDILMHLRTITGGIVISHVGNMTDNDTFIDEIVFPKLEFVGGQSYLGKNSEFMERIRFRYDHLHRQHDAFKGLFP